jgi:hypothetical protein
VIAAGCAVAGFGTFFSMPWRLLPFPIAVGMLAHAARWALISRPTWREWVSARPSRAEMAADPVHCHSTITREDAMIPHHSVSPT